MSENPYAGQGSVLLDIGGDIGALVVTMPAELEGIEVEINRLDGSAQPEQHHHGSDHDHDHGHHHHDAGGDYHHSEAGQPHRPHVAVIARQAPSGVVHSLVFPELAEGRYELYQRPHGPVELQVTIRGGHVTQESWPQ